ncbi:MAG: diacylglycerol kinase family lipid kinase [Coriobacteriia bacterium]|nr:diacylglycerol kinase family lipid kinase [Coriobacteriia bacterium]
MAFHKALVIINPAARHGETAPLIPVIEKLLESTVAHETILTERPGHAAQLAKDAVGFDLIIAVGGDGTAHEVLNGIMARPEGDRPAMSLFPTGSGNDWRRTLGISTDLPTAVRQVLSGHLKKVDVGVCNGIHFANSLAIGLDARVTAKAVELKVTTGWSGLALYVRALMYVLFHQFYSHPIRLKLDDGPVAERDVLIVALTNGPTYGGGFHITPKAVDDDGLLDMCIIDKLSLPSALWRLPFVIAGKHEWMSMVHMQRHAHVELWSDTPVAGQVDGEVLLDDHYEISIIPGGIGVIVPRSE